jgi:uncharacterized membrane protein YfcA
VGGVLSAFFGTRLVSRLSDRRLLALIAALLGALGLLLMTEAVLPFQSGDLLPASAVVHFAAGIGIGIGVGLVSSVLGVAGGELLIAALVLIFGVDIKIAGSDSARTPSEKPAPKNLTRSPRPRPLVPNIRSN